MHRKILTSALALTTAMTGAAFAQEEVADEIIVTAERREQNLQDVALAVSVIGAEELNSRGVSDVRDLAELTPGLNVLEVGQQPSVLIRGVGNAVANFSQDPGASFNVDGVPIARPLAINAAMFDLARVEVLKGPQGTLYGRNATAGAINVITREPSFENGASIDLRAGNYDLLQFRMVGNAAFSDEFAVRVGVQSETRDGYLSNGANDADSLTGRIRALWEPTNNLRFLGSATFSTIGGVGPNDVPLKGGGVAGNYIYPDDPYRIDQNDGSPVACAGIPAAYCDGLFVNSLPNLPQSQEINVASYSLQMDWDLGPTVLTVVPAYIDTTYDAITYNGGFRQIINSTDEQTSLEVRLSSDHGGPLTWIIGGFYMADDQTSFNDIHNVPPARLETTVPYLNLDTFAVFGQGTYSLTDRLRLTLGVRYTEDQKEQQLVLRNGSLTGMFGPPATSFGDFTWDYLSYRAGLEFDLTDDNLIYFNVSDAYKSGGLNPGDATGPVGTNTYEPEHLTSYQIGSRNEFADGRLIVNLEAWYWLWEDLQIFQIGCFNQAGSPGAVFCPANTNIGGVSRNSEEATSYGAEIETRWLVTEDDSLTFNLTYLNNTYEEAFLFPFVLDGQSPVRSPEWSGLVSYQRDWNLSSGGVITATLTDQFSSEVLIVQQRFTGVVQDPVNGRVVEEDGWHSVSADLAFTSPDRRWTFGIWGENLNESDHTVFAGNTPAGIWGHATAPRTYGIRLGANF